MADEHRPSDHDRIRKAARWLSPRERSVLVLSAVEDQDIEAVAARLGLTPAETETSLADAIRKLDRALR